MTVLIVDDEIVVRIGLKSMIDWQAEGFDRIFEAGNGREALPIALSERPDVIITDIKMPEMDGLELIEALKSHRHSASIVVLSSYSDFDFVRQAMAMGAMDYILKLHMTGPSLQATLRNIVKKRGVSEQDQNGFARNLPYLQQRMLKDALLSGGEAEQILMDMRSSLQLSIQPQNCIMALIYYARISADEAEDSRMFSAALLSTIDEICRDHYCLQLVPLASGQLCLLLSPLAEAPATTDEFHPYALLIVEMLHNYMNVRARLCVCPTCDGRLHHALMEAMLVFSLYRENPVLDARILRNFPSLCGNEEQLLQNQHVCEQLLSKVATSHDYSLFRRRMQEAFQLAMAQSVLQGGLFALGAQIAANDFSQEHPEGGPTDQALLNALSMSAEALAKAYSKFLLALSDQLEAVPSYPHLVRTAVDYIETHYYESITAKDVADNVGLSPSYFGSLFRQTVGINPARYIIDVRIRKAQNLLRNTTHKVYEISEMVGYSNNFYFNRLFKKLVGVTPNEYRNGQDGSQKASAP